jgi:hypothetical protein
MSNVRQRLIAALDEAEARSRRLLVEVQYAALAVKEPRLLGTIVPGWALWPDVERLCADRLRLIERDRALLKRHKTTTFLPEGSPHAETCRVCDDADPCDEVRAAAAFWLNAEEGAE